MQRVVCLSDTHGRHHDLEMPDGDVVVHAGDFSKRGRPAEVLAFLEWYAALSYPHKVLVGGNHDFLLDDHPDVFREMLPDGVVYLDDEPATVAGLSMWGSPVTPWFHSWAFNRRRGAEIQAHWSKIPDGLDVLITHGPPLGHGDETAVGTRVGCEDLLTTIMRTRPRFHVFGHIHEGRGITHDGSTTFINASNLDVSYRHVQAPIVIEV